ncbi:MAG: N-acetylneuraminate synthase family protein [Hyphomicrobiales bacterium]|nr:N-acetylneuraminate synthase family protein [Hyphomicrobiales bacterium]
MTAVIHIGGRPVGPGQAPFVIAEVGINHNGDLALALDTIDAIAAAGAHCAKFQNYRTEDFILDRSLTYEYLSRGETVRESQYDMFKRCELDGDGLARLKERCDARGIAFMSTPTGTAGIDDLVRLGAPALKNGSDFLTHLELIAAMARTGLPTILSTGMATGEEIDDAVAAYRAAGGRDLVLLHCVSLYPTPLHLANVRRVATLAETYGCLAGFSDHTDGTAAAIAAACAGAAVIEKHVTLDKNLPGPDHRFSADADELGTLVRHLAEVHAAMGRADLEPTAEESGMRADCRLSCVAVRDLDSGHPLARADIGFYRPGTGLPPKRVGDLVGRCLDRGVAPGHVFTDSDFA